MRIGNENVKTHKEQVTTKLIDIFKDHIGLENAIGSEELFFKVMNIHPEDIDYYERAYKWNFVKRVLSVLRKSGTLFVITGTAYHYVLNNKEELETYKTRTDATIKGLHNIKAKAERWLTSEELKKLRELKKKKEKSMVKKILKVVASK